MNTHGHDESFDRAMRELHQQALSQVSAPTRARLRAARTPASQHRFATRGFGWVLATGFAAVFAVAIGLQLRAPSTVPDLPQPADTGTASYDADAGGAVEALDENPDFYLWLASNDDTPPDALER